RMGEWAESASRHPDSKARTLVDWLKRTVRPNGQWSDERVIIFTEYRATQNWLHEALAREGLAQGERLMTMYGGMPTDERERIKAAFQTRPADSQVRILLATDAASEGIDLQLHCHRVVHYEIPWNPNRMEQRNGRVDRHGQRHNPLVFHFVPAGYQKGAHWAETRVGDLEGDLEFLMRAVVKVEQIREDLGKVGPVIAQQVEEAMLGRRRQFDTQEAERKRPGLRGLLRFERNLRAQIERLHDQLQESRQALRLSPENIQAAVEIALDLAGQPRLEPVAVEGIWPDPTGQRRTCPVFRLPALHDSWARCTEGLAHPHTGVIRPIVFDHDLARGRDDVVLVHLNHRLVQMALRLLRAEVWSREGAKKLHRATARVVPDHLLGEPVVIAHGRLVITGGDGQRLHEEVISAGGEIRQGRFRRVEQVGRVQELLDAGADREPSEAVKARLVELWPTIEASLKQSLEARAKERTASLERQLAERAEKEAADITAILRELERQIQAELDGPGYEQLELFTVPEREQYQRDVSVLRARLDQIPAEIEQEVKQVHQRYADPQPRLF
ncbi:MAG: DISARM system SNF2-like helicase DrmD, partial [Anaerolineae bacterium]|nr:DISARM system SNF2-like helicase DrmD [Anaerolineae bacterium]